MGIFDFIGSIIKPITNLIDDLVTSDEERGLIQTKMVELQNSITAKMIDYETKLMEAQSSIIVAEAQGQSWLQRSWRPITMLTFLVLVVCDSFGLLAFRLASEAWLLLQIGLGGYVIGRSAEKIVPKLVKKL